MISPLQKDINDIKTYLLEMCGLVEESLRTAILALKHRDPELAKRVIEQDSRIDALENNIDTFCLKTLALRQPVASDLRFITSAMSMIRDLERIGDQAVNVAERVLWIMEDSQVLDPPKDLYDLADEAIKMLTNAINSFVYRDTNLAQEVKEHDETVDQLYRKVTNELIELIKENPQTARSGVYLIVIALNLERVADQATNIGEDVIYYVEGRLVKHEACVGEGGLAPIGPCKELWSCLKLHAEYVQSCVERLPEAIRAYFEGDYERCRFMSAEISKFEREADKVKQNIRGSLPKGIIIPVDKFELFLYLKEQDAIADSAEDILRWLTFRRTQVSPVIANQIIELVETSVSPAKLIISMLDEAKAYFDTRKEGHWDTVRNLVREIRRQEHEADQQATDLRREIFSLPIEPLAVYHLLKLTEFIGDVANHAENTADLMRAMIAR